MKRKTILLATSLVASLLMVGCSNTTPTGLSITSENDVHSLEVGQTLQLKAEVSPKGASQAVIWESANIDVATVSETGLVTTVKEGNLTIKAYSKENQNIKGEYKIVVNSSTKEIAPTALTIVSSKTTIKVDEVITLAIRTTPENATSSVTYSSSDTTVASVSAAGQVKGLKEGSAKITATSTVDKNVKAELTIMVEAATIVPSTDYSTIPYATHEEFINAEKNTTLKIKGTAKYVYEYTNKSNESVCNFYLLNGNTGYYVYGQRTALGKVVDGHTYEVGGAKGYYNGGHQMANTDHLVELSEKISYEVTDISSMAILDVEGMYQYHGGLVTLKNAVVSSLPSNYTKVYSMKVKAGDNEIALRVDPANMSTENFNSINEKVKTLAVGSSIEATGCLTAFGYGKPASQITILEDTIVSAALDNASKLELAKEGMFVKCSLTTIETKISLPTKSTVYEEVSISWASSDTSVISTDGTVSHKDTDKEIELTATFTLGELTATRKYKVTVLMADDSALNKVYTLDFEDASKTGQYNCSETKNGYAPGDVTLGTPEQKTWALDYVLIEYSCASVISGDCSGRMNQRVDSASSIYNKEDIECNGMMFTVRPYNSNTLQGIFKISYSENGTDYVTIDREYVATDLTTIRTFFPTTAKRVKITLGGSQQASTMDIDDIVLYK